MDGFNELRIKELLLKAQQAEYQVCVWGAGKIGTGIGKKILEDYGIHIDYYCDNNLELAEKLIIDGIYCKSQDYLISNSEKTICFLLIGYTNIKSVYLQMKTLGIRNIVTYEELLGYSITLKRFFPFMEAKDTAIYTCISGEYDELREPVYISDRCDYYFISEKKPERETVYQWIDILDVVPSYITDSILRNRYCKMNPDKIFPQYRYSVYLDGNITIMGDITKSIEYLKRARIGVTSVYEEDTVYLHGLRCMVQGLDYYARWQKQMNRYWLEGLPGDIKVSLCNILVREHNNPVCVKLMRDWWDEFCKYVRRDQVSFPYILWKNGYSLEDIMELNKVLNIENPLIQNPYWKYEKTHVGSRTYK